MEEYNAVHRYFSRYMLNAGVVSKTRASQILNGFPGDTDKEYEIEEVVALINRELRDYRQVLKFVVNEHTQTEEVAFLWLADDGVSQLQEFYSKEQTEYFKWLLEEIITSNTKSISGIDAMNLMSKVESRPFSKTQTQNFLNHLCLSYYLRKDESYNYFLNTRTIHEFEHYIKTHYSDFINSCHLCKNLSFYGNVCNKCGQYFHIVCLKKYFKNSNDEKCPNCKNQYDDDWGQFVEE